MGDKAETLPDSPLGGRRVRWVPASASKVEEARTGSTVVPEWPSLAADIAVPPPLPAAAVAVAHVAVVAAQTSSSTPGACCPPLGGPLGIECRTGRSRRSGS